MNQAIEQFTQEQLNNWAVYEAMRLSGHYNTHCLLTSVLTGLSKADYFFCMQNYSALKAACEAAEDTHYDQMFQ